MCHRIINSATNECAGFPDSSVGKESACNGGDPGSIPESGRSPGEGIFYPLQYSWASLVAELVKNPPAMWETWFNPWIGKIPWRRERVPTPVFWPGEFYGLYSPVQFSSVAQSCPTLCNPMNCSTPGLPVHHQLWEFIQAHAH